MQLKYVQNPDVVNSVKIKATIQIHQEDKFRKLMEIANIKPSQIIESLDMIENQKAIFRAGEGGGKSGSFFFFSKDNKFLIKTLQGNERQLLENMLDDFIRYFTENKNSLIAKIFGLYTIKTDRFKSVDMIIMENTAHIKN